MTVVIAFLLGLIALVVGHRWSYSLGAGGDGGLGTLLAAAVLALLAGLFAVWRGIHQGTPIGDNLRHGVAMIAWTVLPPPFLVAVFALTVRRT